MAPCRKSRQVRAAASGAASRSSFRRSNEAASIGDVVRSHSARRRRRASSSPMVAAATTTGAGAEAGRARSSTPAEAMAGPACWRRRRPRDADIVVFMDGDGADDPAAIAALVDPIRVRRVRFRDRLARARRAGAGQHGLAPGRSPACWPASACGCSTACATPTCARSAPSGAMRCWRLGMREMTYGWNIEMQMRAARSGLRIVEIPVPYHRRTGGSSKVAGSLRGTIRAGARIVSTFVRVATQAGPRSDAKRKSSGCSMNELRPDYARPSLIDRGRAPLLERNDHSAPSVFRPENMLRESRRQKGLGSGEVPPVCLLDPDGDIVDYVRTQFGATRSHALGLLPHPIVGMGA